MRDPKPQGIEAITVRRAKIADADKVRYRVYRTPSDYVAVIAESALMAVKVAGITAPYKIMRDLPTEGIAIEAKRMASVETTPERVTLSTEHFSEKALLAELPDKAALAAAAPPFVAVGIADLRGKGAPRARILPPQLLTEIIEQHVKAQAAMGEPPAAEAVNAPPAESPPVAAEPHPAEADDAPAISAEEHIIQAPREPSVEEKIQQMADEMQLPASASAEAETPREAAPVLSNDEVEKLLNGPQ